ncbi:hypothetical protein BIW11_00506 [Tropilaelaps mercedesae]|uniref:Uncharacterized protein n=1 Tax=Tropilaelaps mercedesae TaxID=418985 RepID=A0A1V9XUB1_9ACAR|nr:hypothetical protein BIW11_00506 [Tropilaelaps mercedesae]
MQLYKLIVLLTSVVALGAALADGDAPSQHRGNKTATSADLSRRPSFRTATIATNDSSYGDDLDSSTFRQNATRKESLSSSVSRTRNVNATVSPKLRA